MADEPAESRPVVVQLLGPLRVWRDGVELDPGPRQQAYLLTLLVARSGRPISTSELIDLLWDDDVPASALNTVHKYVGALRRVLEPSVLPRSPGSYIHRKGNGYEFDDRYAWVDLVRFRRHLEAARASVAGSAPDRALPEFELALSAWSGPAGEGLHPGANAHWLFSALNEEFLEASVEAAAVAVPLGRTRRIVQPLRLAAWIAPFNESVQASLMTSLAAAGKQAEAFSVFDGVRARLADELGVDPGPELRQAYQQVLRQSEALVPEPARGAHPSGPGSLVGRAEEMAILQRAIERALSSVAQVVIVEGEPGVGKSRLLTEAASTLDGSDATVVWGRCQEGGVTPSLWPWVQIVGALLARLPDADRAGWEATELGHLVDHPVRRGEAAPARPSSEDQFRLFGDVVALVAHVAQRDPVLLVLDDLHWADAASLRLFRHLAEDLPPRGILVGATRDRAPVPNPDLKRMLAAVARRDNHRRIALGPLEPSEVADLVLLETGQVPIPDVARSIQARTEGNPFFVRELARFLADGNDLSDPAAAQAAVPSTVRDIVRDAISSLDDGDRELIQIAALVGRDIDIRLLARAASLDPAECLGRVETFVGLGLIDSWPDDPGGWRFAHDLVRESVIRGTTRADTSRMHLRIADAMEEHEGPVGPHAEALAHHLRSAGPLTEPERTARALVAAGRIAARRSAYDTAERDLDFAARIARGAGLPELELAALSELTAVAGIHSGFVGAGSGHLDRAEEVARSLGREREATGLLFSRFLAHAQGLQVETSGRLARRLLEQGRRSADQVVQASGHHAWGVYQWSSGQIGEAYRNLMQSKQMIGADPDVEPLRHRLQMLTPVMLALNAALHGDLVGARELFDQVEAEAGDDPYAISIWGSFSATAAAVAGDVAWAAAASDRAIALDPDFSFSFSGSYPRLARQWATALGQDRSRAPAAATEVERLIEATLVSPPRSNLATWYALLAEIHLVAGDPAAAMTALDRAEATMAAHGERYAEGLVLFMRAKTLLARGDPPAAVRAAAQRAVDVSEQREAHLFAQRARELL